MKSGSSGSIFDPASFQKYGEYASRKQVEAKVLELDPRARYDIAHRNSITDRVYAQLEKQRQSDMRERENGGAAILNWCFENGFDIDNDIAHRNSITDRVYAQLEKQRQSDMRERENGGAAILNWCFENGFDIDNVPVELKNRVTPSDFAEIAAKAKPVELKNRVTPSDFAEIAAKAKAFRDSDESGDRNLYIKYMTNDKALLELSDAGYTLVRAAVPGNVRQALDDQRARLKEKDAMARQQQALDVRDAQVGKFKPEYEVLTTRERVSKRRTQWRANSRRSTFVTHRSVSSSPSTR